MAIRREHAAEALPLYVIDYLLGFNRPASEIHAMHTRGVVYDVFFQFDPMPDDLFQSLWRQHGAFLKAEAKRRGIDLPPNVK